jgi:sRNA-binding protein
MHEGIAPLAELYPNCFCQPRQPLKIGIREDISPGTRRSDLA